jgi:hypothetical protein
VPKFKIGDKVYVRRDVYTGVSPEFLDYDRVYTIIEKRGSTLVLDGGLEGFGFVEEWLLLPAKCEVKVKEGRIKDVKFSGPATIVFWTDGTKTVVKCGKGDKFDPEKGIAMACAKKLLGNEDGYHKDLEKYLTKNKTTNGGIESMKTEEIRSAVRAGCRLFPSIIDDCTSRCPCRYSNGGDGTCCTIALGSRDQLIKMLKSFEKAGYFNYEDWRMSHA